MKKMLLSLVILLISFPIVSTYAQEQITGRVIDIDGNSLYGASILLVSPTKYYKGVTTTGTGTFEIEMNSDEKLKISYLGYKEKVLDIEEIKFDNLIILEGDTHELTSVVVTAEKEFIGGCNFCCCYLVRSPVHNEEKNEEEPFKEPEERNWSYYPNPTIGLVQIESQKDEQGIIEVFNINGELLSKFSHNARQTAINLNDYPSGTYILRYNNENEVENIGRVVKVE